MPRIINEDLIAKIAELAGRGYSKSAAGRELNLDRATVRKYWPKEKEEKEAEKHKPSIEEQFRLLTKRTELRWDIGAMLSKIGDRQWETTELRRKGRLVTARVRFLKDEVEKAEALDELDSVSSLMNQEQDGLTPLLDEDNKLRSQRLEREEKKRQEKAERRRSADETLRQHYLAILPWYIPCPKYIKGVVSRFLSDYGYEDWAGTLGSQLATVNELQWRDDIDELQPLCREFLSIITGHPEEKRSVIQIMVKRRERIVTARDEDLINAFDEWLNFKDGEEFVKGALKLSGMLSRLAQERYIDIDELLEQEAPRKEKVKVKQK